MTWLRENVKDQNTARPEAEFYANRLAVWNIKVYVMMTESSASRLLRELRRIRLSKPVRKLQRSSKCDQKPLAP